MSIVWHHATVTRERRNKQNNHNNHNNHKSVVLWFTGLSGSGKSALAHAVEERHWFSLVLVKIPYISLCYYEK